MVLSAFISGQVSFFFMDVRRILRVSEAVKEELYEIIGFEMEDPRLLEVEVTDVQVSPDSRHAAIKVALRGSSNSKPMIS